MKKIILIIIVVANFFSINYVSAQANVKKYIRMAELSVKNVDVASKGLLKLGPSLIKASNGVITGRNAYTSESGLVYALTGFEDLGKFMQENNDYWNKASLENPGVADEMSANAQSSNVQSIWVKFDEASNSVTGYKPTDYDFRRLSIVNVIVGKSKEYDALLIKQKELMLKYGFNINRQIYKTVVGYTQSSYLTILADHSMTEYVTSRSERMKKMLETPEFKVIGDALRACTVPGKVDFLYRIK